MADFWLSSRCKIGSGFVVYPARMIGSNTTLIYADNESVIGRNVQHVVSSEEADESGELVRTVYKWPNRFNIDEAKASSANSDSVTPRSSLVGYPSGLRSNPMTAHLSRMVP